MTHPQGTRRRVFGVDWHGWAFRKSDGGGFAWIGAIYTTHFLVREGEEKPVVDSGEVDGKWVRVKITEVKGRK